MRIGIGGKSAVFSRRLVEAQPAPDFVIGRGQTRDGPCRLSLVDRGKETFLGSEEQFRHHVPVNAPQTFESEHRSASAGEGVMMEDRFVKSENLVALLIGPKPKLVQ